MHIVLVNPEIPQNTGNIARTCAATRAQLHLIEPFSFDLSDKYLKRAGLDYWPMVKLEIHRDLHALFDEYPDGKYFFASTKAARSYCEVDYPEDAFLVFGCETRGLPETLLKARYDDCIRIPMRPDARSLNLSNSVAIVVYEALRQNGFPGLESEGHLTGRDEPSQWLDYV